jgi:hypothetical protein
MCANYHPATSARFQQNFERLPPGIDWKPESFPGCSAPFPIPVFGAVPAAKSPVDPRPQALPIPIR